MKKANFSIALVLSATVAIAQTDVADQGTGRGPSNDANEVICIKEAETGSRIAQRRVCRTRAQWDEHRRQLRQAIDQVQHQTQCPHSDPNKC